jgi:A-factor type gamma-butyrolactone 1'-reductase (1S-forming)
MTPEAEVVSARETWGRGAGLLAGKAIVITGGSSGIGAAAARVFAREGAAIVINARDETALRELVDQIRSCGAEASCVAGDISNPATGRRLVYASLLRYGRLDGAFNNAGVAHGGLAVGAVPEHTFERDFAINVKGVWLAMCAETEAMLRAGTRGAIVNTSSIGGTRGTAKLGVYGATKHAIIGLTRAAAHDYGPRGLRINALAPGMTDTPMIAAWKQREPDVMERMNALTPLGRAAQPSEVAEAAAWLLSDRASYVTGAVLTIDGGMTA